MMKQLEKDRHPEDGPGLATVRFISHKYANLFPYLLTSILLGYVVYAFKDGQTIEEFFTRIPLLIFDILPLRIAGFKGVYVLGISWYISAMFFSMAVLYPLCRKYRTNFVLLVCPVLGLLIYGFLSQSYGNIAVASTYLDGYFFNSGLLRGIAASSLGCVLYEWSKRLSNREITKTGRGLFTLAEMLCFVYMIYTIHMHPKSQYDYVLVLVMFVMLLIGMSGVSLSSVLFRGKWTKWLGTASMLIVFNHYCWNAYLKSVLGKGYAHTDQVWYYVIAVAGASIVVYCASKLLVWLGRKLKKVKVWA